MKIQYSSQFKKDYKRLKKQNKNLQKFRKVLELLLSLKPLPDKYSDHQLLGKWRGFRDCHIEPDWILIYKWGNNYLRLERMGSHSELFQ